MHTFTHPIKSGKAHINYKQLYYIAVDNFIICDNFQLVVNDLIENHGNAFNVMAKRQTVNFTILLLVICDKFVNLFQQKPKINQKI